MFVITASRNYNRDAPPAYTAPTSPWYAAPPPAYTANPGGYMGWVPPTNVFPDQPPANTVYMTESPPPYPGITGYARHAADFASDYKMPHLDFAVNHYGKPDVAMFDFTSMFQVSFIFSFTLSAAQ